MKLKLRPTKRAAMQIAIKAGLLKPCTQHWVYLKSRQADALEHAFRLGNYLISHFARSVACFKGNRKLMTDTLVKCRNEGLDYCPQCQAQGRSLAY
ncbi:MAG: hypothetical protein QM703_10590 [Gemmatales bacterium]